MQIARCVYRKVVLELIKNIYVNANVSTDKT